MKIGKQAPELLKKAATLFRSKTAVLRTRLLVLASLRRRTALVAAVTRGIHALVSSDGRRANYSNKQARLNCHDRALMLRKAMASKDKVNDTVPGLGHSGMVVDLSEMTVFHEDGHGFPDWTQSLFDEDCCYVADEHVEEDEDGCDLDHVLDEPSVIEVIRINREVQGLEFNMDEEIDEACDMFIRRFRSRMNQSL